MSDRGLGKIWIANTSMQTRVFYYRLDFIEPGAVRPRVPSYRELRIASGSQESIDINVGNADEIVEQLVALGAIEMKELPRVDHVVAFVYRLDQKVPPQIIKDTHAHNTGLKVEEGRERRELAAVAASQAMSRVIGAEVPEIKVDMEQLEVSENDEARIEEGFVVKARPSRRDREEHAKRRPKAKAA